MTVTDPSNSNQRAMVEVRALRMLRAGDSVKDVSQATGLTAEEIAKLNRDFPSTAPVATTARPAPAALQVVPAPARPELGTAVLVGAGGSDPAPLTIARLLEEASVHSSASIRTLGKAIEDKLDNLRARIKDQAAEEQAKQRAAAERAQAKAEVARLEKQLADAKARLRSGKTSTATPKRMPVGDFPCRKCSKQLATPQGRGNHEKTCAGPTG